MRFIICKNKIHLLSSKKLENIVSKFTPNITENYIHPRKNGIKAGLPLVFIDSVYFQKNSL